MKSSQFIRAEINLSESKISSKPNFKIKSLLINNRNRSKNNLGKSLDLSKNVNNMKKEQSVEKRLIRWRKDQKKIGTLSSLNQVKKISNMNNNQNPETNN